jgi:hypothetical protein
MTDPKNEEQTTQVNGHDPATEVNQIDASALGVPEGDNRVLQALPGLTGAIDLAFQEQVGKKVAFVLVAFGDKGAAFTTNIEGAHHMRHAMRQIQDSWNEPTESTPS